MTTKKAHWKIVDDTYGHSMEREQDQLSVVERNGLIVVRIETNSYVDVPGGSVFEVVIKESKENMGRSVVEATDG